jgi:3-oxoacyl-(acyl-carrier-protein) synthase/NAD(P)-dependent dehydrogenase (short-subunit alcohol dehydrogenase family)
VRDLVGKTALVTGGGKGVGKEIARSLASRGADVIINCFHSYAIAKATKAELEKATGARISLMRASVAKVEQVRQLFEQVEAEHGGLDILVNNAASGRLGPVSEIQPEHFARALDTNLLGSFWCSIYAAPLMAKRGGGTIVNVSSLGAGLVPDNYLVVGTSKAAVEALTRHLAIELAPLKIRVNTASCSLIEGDVAKLFPRADELEAVTVATTPLGRLATARDLSGVVTFLTSDLSSWVTGQVVLADGGASLANAMLSPPRKSVPILPAEVQARLRVDAGQPQSARQRRDFITSTTASAPDGVAVEGPRNPGDGGRGPQDVDDPVVVVGMGLAVPGANSPDEYWAQMMEGAERFVEAPPGRWCVSGIYSADTGAEDKTYQARAGFMTGFEPDSRLAEDIARGVVGSEHTTRWLRHCVYQALRDVHRGEGDRAALAVGYTADGSQHLEEALVLAGATASVKEALAARDDEGWGEGCAAYRQKLEESFSQGGSDPASYLSHEVARAAVQGILPTRTSIFVVDTACSSSLYTIDIGMMLLNQGKCDIAICGGAFALAPRGAVMFAKLRGLSRGGAVRSLDRSADGVLFSDGAGVVVLKRLSRAVADGDHVLGIIRGVGSSSDGKGEAIYAPNPTGQRLAIDRALSVAGVSADQIDWVVAHATGTPAGDSAEFSALRAAFGDNQRTWVTSNKSLIGHTGWAAGVVSVIEVILALQHETIPRQHRFEAPPQSFQMDGTCLSIPTAPVAWPPYTDRPRFASVSAFGFGGTNANLIVEEHTGRRRPLRQAPATPERVAIVGWSAHMPGVARGDLASWVEGAVQPEASFGERYDPPSFERLRLPPSTVRTMDRSQLMALECAFQLQEQLGGLLIQYRDKTGTLIGHMGPTRNAVMYSLRTYLEPIENLLAESPFQVRRLHERISEYIRGTVPPPNEDAFPGSMPNVIPSRVANYLDLHGLNMTVDTGPAATLTALEVARLYLQSGVLDVAFVGGVNGNSTPAITEVLRDRLRPGTIIAEGAVMFALVRESTAADHGLPVLAYLGGYEERADVGLGAKAVTVGPGTSMPRTYLGADGAIGVLKALQSRSQDTLVACVGAPGAPVVTLRLRKEPAPGATGLALPSREAAQVQSTAAGHENAGPYAPRPPAVQPSSSPAARRYTVDLAHAPLTAGRPPQPFFPNGTLVLTDIPERVDEVLASSNQALLLSVRPLSRSARGRAYLREVNPGLVRAALAELPSRPRHIRVITDLTAAIDPENGISQRPDALLALHDLLFLVLQKEGDDLVQVGGSVIITMLRGVRGGHLHAFTGLFSGFAKSAALELGGVLVYAMATSTDDLATAINEATKESEGRRLVPLVAYDNGRRLAPRILRAGPETAGSFVLDDGSVVLAVGGSRGIAAEALKALASRVRPTIYVLGSTDLSAVDEGPADHEGYIRWSLSRRPGISVAVANRAYLKASQARLARANLSDLASRSGGRTHYLVVDVRDAAGVQKAIDSVFAAEGRVDLVVNAAGINR